MDRPTDTVTLMGHEVELVQPSSYAVRAEITALASGGTSIRAAGAALGYCWGVQRRGMLGRVTPSACRHDPAVYGGAVVDRLVGLGVPLREVLDAGRVALALLCGHELVSEEEVREAVGFFEANEEGSTG